MVAGDINHTLKLKVQDNKAVVGFENKSDTTAKLRRKTVLGILDLRPMSYFKVDYQKMVTMTESGNNFHMHHYQQIAECDLYFKMSCNRGPPRITSNRSEKSNRKPREDPYPWLAEDDPRRF